MSKSIFKSSLIISSSILCSRIFGLIRDIVIASIFGAGSLTDEFFIAFRIPNLLRRIFAEGAFNSAFTPAFAKKIKKREEARLFASRMLFWLLLFLIITLCIFELFAPTIINLIAPGFSGSKLSLTVSLSREVFPYIVLISLVAFFGAMLNGFEHFFAPAFSTVLFNISMIACAILLHKSLSIHALCIGVLIGGTLQLMLQLFFLRHFDFIILPSFGIDDDVKETLRNTVPGIFGFAERQLSMLMDTVLASFLGVGSISYLYYANRFVQLPLGVFAIGISQVLLPRLSKKSEDSDGYRSDLAYGLRFCAAVIVPASMGLIFFGKPILDVVLNHGRFSNLALSQTYRALFGYSLGLYFFSVEKILINTCYSLGEFKLPVKVSFVSLILNLFLDVFLCFYMGLGVMGLAIGTSIASLLNVLLLSNSLYRSLLPKRLRHGFKTTDIFSLAFPYLILSVPIGLMCYIANGFYFRIETFSLRLLFMVFVVSFSAALYLVCLFIKGDGDLIRR